MRIIKFRGKRIDNNEWVFGSLILCSKAIIRWVHNPLTNDFTDVEVQPETVGQFTGLTNKEGDEIYEGDKLLNPQGKVGRVEFHNGSFCLVVKETKVSITRIMLTEGFCGNKSIIGNIHDNN